MNNNLFTNAHILDWLNYYSDNYDVDLERVKILDITRKNKNLIPTVESHKYVLVFTEAGHPDIFYRMFNAGLGECTCVYNEGSDPSGFRGNGFDCGQHAACSPRSGRCG